MKLSLEILQHYLTAHAPQLTATLHIEQPQAPALTIETIALSNSPPPPVPHTLWVGPAELFLPGTIGTIAWSVRGFIHTPVADMSHLANVLWEGYWFYRQWELDLIGHIGRGDTLTSLLDGSHHVLPFPMFVMDSSDSVIAISTAFLQVPLDKHWEDLVATRASAPDIIFRFHSIEEGVFQPDNHALFSLRNKMFPHDLVAKNLYFREKWCGIFNAVEHQPMSLGEIHLFDLLHHYIQRWLDIHDEQKEISSASAALLHALSGDLASIETLQRKLSMQGWKPEDHKQFLHIQSLSGHNQTDGYLGRVFSSFSPYLYAALGEGEILLLGNMSQLSWEQLERFLTLWLERSTYAGGCSYPFRDLKQLPQAYRQAKLVCRCGQMQAGRLRKAESCVFPWFIEVLHSHTSDSIRHPDLSRLSEYDQLHHSQLYDTLFCFLSQERNHIRTAEKLSIHRNTLFHRLERIHNLITSNLEDERIRMELLLSFYLEQYSGNLQHPPTSHPLVPTPDCAYTLP